MVEMMMYALFRELILHTWKHIRPRVCLTANIENYTKSYKKDINDRIPKVKPQNPILLIVFHAAFAKVEHCRWVHFFAAVWWVECVCLMSAWNTISIGINIFQYNGLWPKLAISPNREQSAVLEPDSTNTSFDQKKNMWNQSQPFATIALTAHQQSAPNIMKLPLETANLVNKKTRLSCFMFLPLRRLTIHSHSCVFLCLHKFVLRILSKYNCYNFNNFRYFEYIFERKSTSRWFSSCPKFYWNYGINIGTKTIHRNVNGEIPCRRIRLAIFGRYNQIT